jgi:hypothetical protein
MYDETQSVSLRLYSPVIVGRYRKVNPSFQGQDLAYRHLRAYAASWRAKFWESVDVLDYQGNVLRTVPLDQVA